MLIVHLCFWENYLAVDWCRLHGTEVVVVTNNADVENSFSYRFIFLDMFPLFQAGALHNLEAFTSFNGPDFFGLPRNTSKIVLRERERVAGKFPQLINTVQVRLCLCLVAAPLNGFHLMMSLNKRVCIIGRCTWENQ